METHVGDPEHRRMMGDSPDDPGVSNAFDSSRALVERLAADPAAARLDYWRLKPIEHGLGPFCLLLVSGIARLGFPYREDSLPYYRGGL